ncbi:MAG: permease-like cell division protein FtsX [Gammaproteobacteria bacterium]|jgi:cell division transport system permease protein
MIARYFRLHFQMLGAALGRVGGTPTAAVLNVLVVAIALALPAAMQVLIENANRLSPAFEDAADFTIYLGHAIDEDRGRALSAEIAGRPDVASTRFISKLEGLADLRDSMGFGGALDALEENPLPHAIRVRPEAQAIADIDALAAALESLPETDLVQLDRIWVERLRAILALGGRGVDIITVLLAASVILVIGNTVRMEIQNRRTEIEVLKLVGATDGFIRRPFLYTGLCLGAIGAVAAAVMIGIGLLLLAGPVRDLAALYAADFRLSGLSLRGHGILVGGGALLGWAGAWLAAARHLRAIEPA